MERLDIDVCRVGLRLPEGTPVFHDDSAFDHALTTTNATQKQKADASEHEMLRESGVV